MKKLLIIFGLLISAISYSQNTYKYPVYANGGLRVGKTGDRIDSLKIKNGVPSFYTDQWYETKNNASIVVRAYNSYPTGFDYICDSISDQVQINEAIRQANLYGGGRVELTGGDFYIDSSIIIRSNVELILTRGTTIHLEDSAECYMVRNYEKGTDNFRIEGGRWKGNGLNQTNQLNTIYGGELFETYYGFGFLFWECSHYEIENMKVDTTCTWAFSNMTSNYYHYDNIEIRQAALVNTDGIGNIMCWSVTIENITGWTKDDFIAFQAKNEWLGNIDISGYTQDITIRNIRWNRSVDGTIPYRGVPYFGIAFYVGGGKMIRNVYIYDIDAYIYGTGLIRLRNYWPSDGIGYIQNFNVRGVTYRNYSSGQADYFNIIYVQSSADYLDIHDINISDVTYIDYHSNHQIFFQLNSAVRNFYLDGFRLIELNSSVVSHNFMSADASQWPMNINITNVNRWGHDATITLTNSVDSLRINAPDLSINYALDSINNPGEGDYLRENDSYATPMIYHNGHWVSLIDGTNIY